MTTLTPAQQIMMEGAKRHHALSLQGREGEWFYPNKVGSVVYGTTATAKALCGKGLLTYHVSVRAIGKYPEVLGFKITEAGLNGGAA